MPNPTFRNPFLSHASENRREAEFISEILTSCGIQPWLAPLSIAPGSDYRHEIRQALQTCDSMIVLVSTQAASSSWTTTEVVLFLEEKAKRPVLPVCLDATEPSEVHQQLERYQKIMMDRSFFPAIEEIVQALGSSLEATVWPQIKPSPKPQESQDRRFADRRKTQDRRTSPLQMRIRKGIEYEVIQKRMGYEKFDRIPQSPRLHQKLLDGILDELSHRYRFEEASSGIAVQAGMAIRSTFNGAWASEEGKSLLENKGLVYFTEYFVRLLFSFYAIFSLDRRQQERRLPGQQEMEE